MLTTSEQKHLDEVESALIDILDGNSWWDIQAKTGVSEERAREIENIYHETSQRYDKRHGI